MPTSMHPAAQVDEAVGAVHGCRQDVRRHDVHRQHRRPVAHARVVDHRVHPADLVRLLRHLPYLFQVTQVPDDDLGARIEKVRDN